MSISRGTRPRDDGELIEAGEFEPAFSMDDAHYVASVNIAVLPTSASENREEL